MPKAIAAGDIRKFVNIARRKDAAHVVIKTSKTKTGAKVHKFKVRTARYLYTLNVATKDRADKIKQSIPPALLRKEV